MPVPPVWDCWLRVWWGTWWTDSWLPWTRPPDHARRLRRHRSSSRSRSRGPTPREACRLPTCCLVNQNLKHFYFQYLFMFQNFAVNTATNHTNSWNVKTLDEIQVVFKCILGVFEKAKILLLNPLPELHSPDETMLACRSCADFFTLMFDISFLSNVCSSISSEMLSMLPINRTASSRTGQKRESLSYLFVKVV